MLLSTLLSKFRSTFLSAVHQSSRNPSRTPVEIQHGFRSVSPTISAMFLIDFFANSFVTLWVVSRSNPTVAASSETTRRTLKATLTRLQNDRLTQLDSNQKVVTSRSNAQDQEILVLSIQQMPVSRASY